MGSVLQRVLFFSYGVICYVLFLGAFFYVPGFMTNLIVPKSIDSGAPGLLGGAILINVLLLAAFALQHSVMARPAFKAWFTRFVPRPIERSTYVLLSTLLLYLLYWQWRPMTAVVWEIEHAVGSSILLGLCFLGWFIVFYATLLIDHFDLFGLRQVTLYLLGKPYRHGEFVTPSLYKFMRHPLYLGWLIFFWATPRMTSGHLLFALVTTSYIFVAIKLEEKDLEGFLGDSYRRYRETTPMILPFLRRQ
jgi:protein-S-isoprenylcysteine O-methyltransferase Ste14